MSAGPQPCPLEVANLQPDEWERVAAIYFQHFQVDKDIVKDMLLQKYKAYPASMNWQNARTIVLKLHSKIVAACTLRHHEKFGFVEVALFAAHRDYERRGLGGLLSSFILLKACESQCSKVLLRASKAATPFWCSQGFKAFTYGSSDLLGAYNDANCMQLPETCQMVRDVFVKYQWVELSLGKCKGGLQLLGDCRATVLPAGPRRERKRDATGDMDLPEERPREYLRVFQGKVPDDAEEREGSGLFDNTKLSADAIFPAAARKRRRQPPRPGGAPAAGSTEHSVGTSGPAKAVMDATEEEELLLEELHLITLQFKWLRQRRRALKALGLPLTPAPPATPALSTPTAPPAASPATSVAMARGPSGPGRPQATAQAAPKPPAAADWKGYMQQMMAQASNPLMTQLWLANLQMQQLQRMQWLPPGPLASPQWPPASPVPAAGPLPGGLPPFGQPPIPPPLLPGGTPLMPGGSPMLPPTTMPLPAPRIVPAQGSSAVLAQQTASPAKEGPRP
eukprot:GGOE01014672.1.p1 GENE.GGOE01014672.1~~GGOE01014672.1.p1  ORF type:complete len:508 (+),score=94.48 GGOE01014672.1:79-1602(+)